MKKLTEEQKMKLCNNLAIAMTFIGLFLQTLAVVIPFVIYGMSTNWAWFIIYYIVQVGIMPVLLMICGI